MKPLLHQPLLRLNSGLNALLDFVYPGCCLFCASRLSGWNPLCPSCWKSLAGELAFRVYWGKEDFEHMKPPLHFDFAVACWDYQPRIETLIHRIKYQGGRRLARYIGRLAGSAMTPVMSLFPDTVIIPVPLHPVRERERGYNQSRLLAEGLSESLSLPVENRRLIRKKNTQTQTRLDAGERQKNVENVFALKKKAVKPVRRVMLVDDVVTTGATLNSCARTLKEAGVSTVMGFSLARPQTGYGRKGFLLDINR